MSQGPAPPSQTVIAEPSQDRTKPGLYISAPWYRYLIGLQASGESSATVKATISETGQTAAITTTAVIAALQTAGLYRLQWDVQVTTAAVTSSSVQLTLSWTSGGVAMTKVGTAVVGNTTTSYDSNSVLIKADGLSDINYATTYASNAANTMGYSVFIICELMA